MQNKMYQTFLLNSLQSKTNFFRYGCWFYGFLIFMYQILYALASDITVSSILTVLAADLKIFMQSIELYQFLLQILRFLKLIFIRLDRWFQVLRNILYKSCLLILWFWNSIKQIILDLTVDFTVWNSIGMAANFMVWLDFLRLGFWFTVSIILRIRLDYRLHALQNKGFHVWLLISRFLKSYVSIFNKLVCGFQALQDKLYMSWLLIHGFFKFENFF